MKKISILLSSALMIITLLIGFGFGYYLTPEYQISMKENKTMDLGTADRLLDLRYLNAMIAHHRAAMILAEQAGKNSARPEIQALSKNILADEPGAIAELYQWKKDWYNDSRLVRDPLVVNLGDYDEKFDLRFLNALIAHHDAGILMTKETRSKSSRTEVLNNIDAVEKFLTDTSVVLKGWRLDWYNL